MGTSCFYWYRLAYTYRNQEFQTLLKENYAVALNSCYLFTKKMFEHDIDSAYGVCIN